MPVATADEGKLIRPGEAAAMLGITPQVARFWVKRGLVRGLVLPNGHCRIYASEVERLLRKSEVYGGNGRKEEV
jgi:predicted site-specific integrase-resolvase